MDANEQKFIRIGRYTSDFRGDDLLGSGGYGSVYAGFQIGNPKNQVAIKIINLRRTTIAQVMNEVQCMLNNRSQGTVEILATQKIKFGVRRQDHYAIVTERMDGNLRSLLQEKNKLSEEQSIEWASKIIKCYKYLYELKLIHRDLKPENVLYKKIQDKIIFKIADFGNSRTSKASKSLTIGKGSQLYISPQQATQGHYTNKTDIYALGCMIFEFLVGLDKVPIQVSKVILNSGQIDLKAVELVLESIGVSKMMIKLVQGCLAYEETDRLSWKDIFTFPIFQKGVNTNKSEIIVENPQKKQQETSQIKSITQRKVKSKIKITPDTKSYAWKQGKYRQDDENNNKCIFQGEKREYQWLCSQDLPSNGDYVFAVTALQVDKWAGRYLITLGIMESEQKMNKWMETLKHTVSLSMIDQRIWVPNQNHTGCYSIECSCQSLHSLPSLIECHVSRRQNTIAWHYNGKEQGKSIMPKSWADGKNLCAAALIWNEGDTVEFM